MKNRNLIAEIKNKIAGKIIVDVTPEVFVFSRNGRSINVGTFVYLYNDLGKYGIKGIGEDFDGCDRGLRIDLFKGESLPDNSISRAELLEAFFRHSFIKIIGKEKFLSPTVTFRGAHNLSGTLTGHQMTSLSNAAVKAGAHVVEFVA
jgi:hypothetical protein